MEGSAPHPHRLPSVRRHRCAPPGVEAVPGAAQAPVPACSDVGMVAPALIEELVYNSSLSTHVPGLYAAAFGRIGWRDSRHLQLEVELGSVLVTVEPASASTARQPVPRKDRIWSAHVSNSDNGLSTADGASSAAPSTRVPPPAVPLLLRAFQPGRRSKLDNSYRPSSLSNRSIGRQSGSSVTVPQRHPLPTPTIA